MRALLPSPQDDVDVHAWYAADWLDRGGVRANFVSSVDGAVSAEGASRGLQTAGDNRVFAALRDLADVVLVGAGTARAEGYRPIEVSAARAAIRRERGLPDTLPTAVISRSLRVDPSAPLFADSTPYARTVVITCGSSDAGIRAALDASTDLVVVGEDEVDLPGARAALEQRGFTRILCEGGPTLFADLVREDVMDELCLSVTPLLAGPGAGRIANGAPWPGDPRRLVLAGLLEEDGALFSRYRRTR